MIQRHSAQLIHPPDESMNDQTQESRVRLLLLDDNGLFRVSLGRLLASEPDLEVTAECGTPAEALSVLKSSRVDMVLLDFDRGTERGNDFMSASRQAGYRGRFLILAGSADAWNSALALKLGVSGIFLKSEPPERLLQAIRLAGNGGIWVDQRILWLLADQLIAQCSRFEDHRFSSPLEERERDVLMGILEGLTNRKIGGNMGLAESSVKNIVQRLFGKAGVKTRGQLVRVALEGSLGAEQEVGKELPNEIANVAPPKS